MYAYQISKLPDIRVIVVSSLNISHIINKLYRGLLAPFPLPSTEGKGKIREYLMEKADQIKREIRETARRLWIKGCYVWCNENGCPSNYEECVNEFDDYIDTFYVIVDYKGIKVVV